MFLHANLRFLAEPKSILLLASVGLFFSFLGCSPQKQKPTLIIKNAVVYTGEAQEEGLTTIIIVGNRIERVGGTEILDKYDIEGAEIIDANGQFVMPGFIEGHGHFSGVGEQLLNVNLAETESWDEVVEKVKERMELVRPGEWVEGRGWHQEKWNAVPEDAFDGYPVHRSISEISPDNPLILWHASGHAAFANEKAMELSGINRETIDPEGGKIIRDNNGNPTGVFEERAMDVLWENYQAALAKLPKEETHGKWLKAIDLAQEECIRKGITSFQDAGSSLKEIADYRTLAEQDALDLRLWVMIRNTSEEMKGNLGDYPIIGLNEHLTVNAIKSEVDGALGSFGAWLLKPYTDKPGFGGQNTTSIKEVKTIAKMAKEKGMQFCVHAIGDRANRTVLDIYEEILTASDNKDMRWRIEHAQHLDTADIPRFSELNVIASMQGIHCTSDAPFVVKRLGGFRAKTGAYAWRSILDSGAKIANGTDAPVEDVDPLKSFYASVTRKRADNGLVFFSEQSMTRLEALHSYTLGNAYAALEEKEKGSIVVGKLADLVILSKDLRTCSDDEILETKVLKTIIGGKLKYEAR